MPPPDSFLQRVQREIADLRTRDVQLEAQERGVRQRRLEIEGQLRQLESAAEIYLSLMPVGDTPEPRVEDVPSGQEGYTILKPAEMGRLTIVEASALILEALGGEGSMQQIVAELKAVGKVKGSNPVNTVSTQLRRFPGRFKWVSRGRWRLLGTKSETVPIEHISPALVENYAFDDLVSVEGDLVST